MKTLITLGAAMTALAGTALGGEVNVTLLGSVDSNFYNSGPFGGHANGDVATLTFTVTTPGTDLAPGQLTNYDIVLSSFNLDINGDTGAMLAGPTACQVQNDFPAADGFRINMTSLASGHGFSAGFGALGTMFSTTDIEMLAGTYDTSMFLTSFSYVIQGLGGQMEIFPTTLIIEGPSAGTPFCDPMDVNSTGFSTTLTGTFGTGVGSGLHLESTSGPADQFAYYLVGNAPSEPGLAIGDGRLCLSTAAGDFIGRYNVAGTNLNSLGQFDAAGVLQNLTGTSTSGTGFDVPAELPLIGSPTIMAGETWHFQLWHREMSGSSNFSNGLSVAF